ncbi:hypothetical protein [Paenibacillus sp. Leaf72]|uniref:hypothetical protein n=1 Tax=Paenibacillus sp. Leaf72 TaxID=1736234 RepID=UPI000A9DF508|nr:hypothetical protein [Paenibacillus sp. Leaf72]
MNLSGGDHRRTRSSNPFLYLFFKWISLTSSAVIVLLSLWWLIQFLFQSTVAEEQ